MTKRFLERVCALLTISLAGSCSQEVPIEAAASLSSQASSADEPVATSEASARVVSSAALQWKPIPFKSDNPMGVTRSAQRYAHELDGGIIDTWFITPDGVDPADHASKILDRMRPSLAKSEVKAVVFRTEHEGLTVGIIYMRRGSEWRRDMTAEESRTIQILLGNTPIGGP